MYRSPEMLVMSMQQEINTTKVHLLLEKKKKKKKHLLENLLH